MLRTITWGSIAWLATLAGCAFAQPSPTRFGIVASTETRAPCVVLSSPAQVGEPVTIAKLDPPEFIPARIRRPIDTCGRDLEPGHAYELMVDGDPARLPASTAVVGDVPPGLTFRDCTGSESVHLTAWRGAQRVWHGYYYLGYDVEPTCAREEIAD